jgi:hypothetical protein
MTWRFNRRDRASSSSHDPQKGTKLDPLLRLDMSFEEALSRFVATKPEEVEESIERSKTKRPPEEIPGNGPYALRSG